MTKIKSIEFEMTQEEKDIAEEMWAVNSCKRSDCRSCPFYFQKGGCLFRTKEVAESFTIKIVKPKLKLYEGMDVSGLMFRNVSDLYILNVYKTNLQIYPISATYRNIKTHRIGVIALTEDGRCNDYVSNNYDVILREDIR